jgi:predicted nucleotidyltransferase
LIDLSAKPDLVWLSRLAADLHAAAPDARVLLAGAKARDLLLTDAHGIPAGRATEDVDIALFVEDWDAFLRQRAALIESGKFVFDGKVLHTLKYAGVGGSRLDLIPFAGVEDAKRQIAWPPDGQFVMNVIGFRETYAAAIDVHLPEGQTLPVAPLPAQMLLKLAAWKDRRRQHPFGKDAHDIHLLLKNYLDAGNQERLYTEAAHLLEREDFDFEEAGAWLLGVDANRLISSGDPSGKARSFFGGLLDAEVNAGTESTLLRDMPSINPAQDLRLLKSLHSGFNA